jgi:cysteinyl-tRNA synthetase
MDDDLNTAGAIGLMFEKAKEMNKLLDLQGDRADKKTRVQLETDRRHLFSVAKVLGVLAESSEDFFRKLASSPESIEMDEVEHLIEERARARDEKDWAKADAVRERLHNMGIILEDGPDGTTWRFDV